MQAGSIGSDSSNRLGTSDPCVRRLIVDTRDGEVGKVVFFEPELIDINIAKDGNVTIDRIFLNNRHP